MSTNSITPAQANYTAMAGVFQAKKPLQDAAQDATLKS
jgi:hypothetical protein